MEKPYFSVVVPVYNVEKYLGACVASVLAQTFINYEIILVNDGSTDSSGVLCDKAARQDARIKVLHKGNGGLSSARNAGVKVANGAWIVFLDSDDLLGDVDFLEHLYRLSDNSDVIIYGCSHFLDGSDKIIRKKYEKLSHINALGSLSTKLDLLNKTGDVSISAWSHSIRKNFFMHNSLTFQENILIGEDIDWFFRLMLSEPVMVGMDGAPYLYRIRSGSLSRPTGEGFWLYRYNAILLSENLINTSSNMSLKRPLLDYLAYQYCILIREIASDPSRFQRNKGWKKTKRFRYLRDYGANRETRLCMHLFNFLGSPLASRMLVFCGLLRTHYFKWRSMQ